MELDTLKGLLFFLATKHITSVDQVKDIVLIMMVYIEGIVSYTV